MSREDGWTIIAAFVAVILIGVNAGLAFWFFVVTLKPPGI